jgi:hypothetical protein
VWVVVALCTLIALTALVLSVPVDLGARVEVHGRPTAQFRVQWLFGRVSKTLRTGEGGAKPPKAPSAEKKKKTGGRTGRSASANARLAWDLLTVPGLLRSACRMVSRLFHCIKVRSLAVDFRADLGDPADTAMVVGVVSQAVMFADLWCPYSFRLMPAFEGEPLLDGEAELAVRLRPINAVPAVLGLVCAPSTLKAIVLVARSRWKKDD